MTHPAHILQELMAELERLRARADAAFQEVARQFPREVACTPGCDDCCHALFDLSTIESLAIALAFLELPRQQRREARRRASKAAAAFDRVMADAFARQGEERLKVLSRARVACPLLEEGRCLLYAQRPLTCRLYGIPAAIEGEPRICHRSRFQPGHTYPTVDLVRVQSELERLSTLALQRIPNLPPGRRDVARTIELCYSHGPLLRGLAGGAGPR